MASRIRAIGFDFGGVMELYPPGKMLTFVAELFGIPTDQYKQEFFKINHLSNIKNEKLEDVFVKAASILNPEHKTNQTAREKIRARMANRRLNTELISWFSILKTQGLKVGILSNYTTDLTARLKQEGIYDLVDTVVVSSEIGFQKPDKEAFDILFSRLGVLPEETIFIDDANKSLEKAQEIGYHPILFKNNEELKNDLEKFGIVL